MFSDVYSSSCSSKEKRKFFRILNITTSTAEGFFKLLLFKSNLCRNKDAPFKYFINLKFQ